jgi:hypothetical protein
MPLTGEAKKLYQREYMRRRRAGKPAAKPKPVPVSNGCAWCGRSDHILVGENAVMICAPCIEQAHVAIAEARAAKKRAAVDVWDDDSDLLPDSTSSP